MRIATKENVQEFLMEASANRNLLTKEEILTAAIGAPKMLAGMGARVGFNISDLSFESLEDIYVYLRVGQFINIEQNGVLAAVEHSLDDTNTRVTTERPINKLVTFVPWELFILNDLTEQDFRTINKTFNKFNDKGESIQTNSEYKTLFGTAKKLIMGWAHPEDDFNKEWPRQHVCLEFKEDHFMHYFPFHNTQGRDSQEWFKGY